MKTLNQKAFTIVELIAVITIMTLILSFGVPQFAKYRKNAANKSALSLIKSVLETAQSFAKTTRKGHYVVFAPAGTADDMNLSLHALKIVKDDGGFQTVEDWIYLPKGIFFKDFTTYPPLNALTTISMNFPNDSTVNLIDLPSIKFNKSTGKGEDKDIDLKGYTTKHIEINGILIEVI